MEQRPDIKTAVVSDDTSKEEAFQNTVLRPIIKMKHDLLVAYTRQYIVNKKQDLSLMDEKRRIDFFNSCFDQDNRMRSELRGLVIGHFTIEEFEEYNQITKAINKRMVTIIKERMLDHIDLLSQ
jgi:uncharacterized protein YrzB (UPF0473 family)